MFEFDENGKEIFKNSEYISALKSFLQYGEDSYDENRCIGDKSHGGYFSGHGWAARALRSLLEEMQEQEALEQTAKERFDEKYMKDWEDLIGRYATKENLTRVAAKAWCLGFNDCKERKQ